MKFLRAVGMIAEPDLPEDAHETLVGHARMFLKAGGKLSLDDWGEMCDATKAAFVEAGDLYRAQVAIDMGLAGHSLPALARMNRPFDDGDMERELILDDVAELIKAKHEQRSNGNGRRA